MPSIFWIATFAASGYVPGVTVCDARSTPAIFDRAKNAETSCVAGVIAALDSVPALICAESAGSVAASMAQSTYVRVSAGYVTAMAPVSAQMFDSFRAVICTGSSW